MMATAGSMEPVSVRYPLHVDYCGVCTMPPEYCEYSADSSKCYEWMKTHLPTHYARIVERAGEQLGALTVSEGKRQTRGGKGMKKSKKKEEVRQVQVARCVRGKKKCVTIVVGLRTFDIDLRKASKVFAQHFSCGSSVTGEDEVVIQGDVWGDLVDFIPEKWPEVEEDSVEFIGDQKR